MREEELGAGPALIFFIDTIFSRNADVLQPNFVHFMLPTQGDDRTHGHARRLHVDQKEANAFLLLGVRIGTHKEEAPIGMLGHCRPGLLTIDDIMVPITDRAGAQGSKVRARTGFGIALAPPILTRQDAGQELGLLLWRTKGVDHGANHGQTKRHQANAIGPGGFFRPDIALRCRPARAAIFNRPSRGDPALFVQDAVPAQEVVFGELIALILLAAQIGGIIFCNEGAHFLLEGQFFGAEFKIHG